MAELVLGIGTSHGPLLNTPPDDWGLRAAADRASSTLMYRGRPYSFADLLALRGAEEFEPQITVAERRARYARCRSALDRLGAIIEESHPDVVVIVSSDHKELFGDELLAGFTVFYGSAVAHLPLSEAALSRMGPGLAVSAQGYVPAEPTTRECVPGLARALIDGLVADDFDVAASQTLPAGRHGNHGLPHGWGFIFQQVMREPVPMVPVFVNTFYPPNQPSARRCHAFGQALRKAIEAWPEARRVAVIASGGLSHFVVDEQFDQEFLAALATDDVDYLTSVPASWLESGSSEMRNWITVSGALSGAGLAYELIDYVPCYRAEAGTGNAMAFTAWR